MKKTICNMCGNEFGIWDEIEGFSIHKKCGYGTKFDGEDLELDLCCSCMEKLIESCSVNPVK